MALLTKTAHLACVRSVASVLLMSQMAACSGQEAGGRSQNGANVRAAVTEVHCAEWQALRVADPDDVSMQGHSPGTLARLIEISPVVITGVVGLQQPFAREGTTLSVVVSSMRGGERFDGTRVDLIWVPSELPDLVPRIRFVAFLTGEMVLFSDRHTIPPWEVHQDGFWVDCDVESGGGSAADELWRRIAEWGLPELDG